MKALFGPSERATATLRAGGYVLSSVPITLRVTAVHVFANSLYELQDALNGEGPTVLSGLSRVPHGMALVVHVTDGADRDVVSQLLHTLAACQLHRPEMGVAVVGPDWLHYENTPIVAEHYRYEVPR